jgi:hypothetical protein
MLGITTLCFVQSQKSAGLKTRSISVSPSIRRMPNGGIKTCSVASLQKMSSRVNHMTSQLKGLVLLSLLNIFVVGSKVLSSPKTNTHKTFNF